MSRGHNPDSTICSKCCYLSQTPAANSRHHLDACRVRKCCWLDGRPNDWNRAVSLHAAQAHGLGRSHPSLPLHDHYCRAPDPWRRSEKYQKVACRWSTRARSSFNSNLLFIGRIRIDGRVRNCLDTDYVPFDLSQSRNFRGALSSPAITMLGTLAFAWGFVSAAMGLLRPLPGRIAITSLRLWQRSAGPQS